jgi:uncharacterized protein
MIFLIPHSESKVSGGKGKPLGVLTPFQQGAYALYCEYDGDYAKLFGIFGKALVEAISANKLILKSPTMPAIERYDGVLYTGISYATLSDAAKEYLHQHVYVASPLFGLIRADCAIPNYKLKFEKLSLQQYWKPLLGKQLREMQEFVIDLLPLTHHKALYYTNGVRVEFVFIVNGAKKPAGHNGKLIKGKFIRWVCENQIDTVEGLLDFSVDGFVGHKVNKKVIEFVKEM